MKIISTEIPEVMVVSFPKYRDERGFFSEWYREKDLKKAGIPKFVQFNHSRSCKNVIRGMHLQNKPNEIGKLVKCISGQIFDVAVDVRPESKTYLQYVSIILSSDLDTMLYVPPGFAHGFCVMSDWADIVYGTTGYWVKKSERAIRWNDPTIGINWPIRESDAIVSDADSLAHRIKQ